MENERPRGNEGEAELVAFSPLDGTPLPAVRRMTTDEVAVAVGRARRAQAVHGARTLRQRILMLQRFSRALMRRRYRLVQMICKETGVPEAEAWMHDIGAITRLSEYWSSALPSLWSSSEHALSLFGFPSKQALVERYPRGVVGLVTQWGNPLALPLRTILPALVSGNAVVHCPGPQKLRSAFLIQESAEEVFGRGLLQVVPRGPEVAVKFCEEAAQVDALVFVGDSATGKRVSQAALEARVPASIELGGKDVAIVLHDAELDRAAQGIVWASMSLAQRSARLECVIVVADIAEEFSSRLVHLISQLTPGQDYGPLLSRAQQEKLLLQLAESNARGAQILVGGHILDRGGIWFEPTVITEEDAEASIHAESMQGPVVSICVVSDEQEAIEVARGLSTDIGVSVWTRDTRRGEVVARSVSAVFLSINNHGFREAIPSSHPSGARQSGVHGIDRDVFEIVTRPQTLVVDPGVRKREPWWFPYTHRLVATRRALSDVRSGGHVGRRIMATIRWLRAVALRWKNE
ncbi:MAG: aldehyde dehydrogenase family protein [Myxococcota bacterium]